MNENMRIGDTEREDAVRRLGEHYEAGRLSADEHSERVDQALQAKTRQDLDALFADLPGPAEEKTQGWRPPWAEAGEQPGRKPPWAARGWRPPRVAGIPVPLIAIAAVAILATLACTIGGGHPPILPLVLLAAFAIFTIRRRRTPNPT